MKFVFGKSHPLVEPAWFLKVVTSEEFFKVHKWISVREFIRFNQDPHNFDSDTGKVHDSQILRHPVKLSGQWLVTGLRYFFQDGFLYVNSAGGFPRTLIDVTAECESTDWPEAEPILGEHCSVSTWGRHYYVRSTKRIFTKEKFNTEPDAFEYLRIHAPASVIDPNVVRGSHD